MATRLAVHSDIEELIRHRAAMFEETGIDAHTDDRWRLAMHDLLEAGLGDEFVVAVVDAPGGDRLLASGTMCVLTRMPHPQNRSGRVAYIQSMWTDEDARRAGHARSVVETLLEVCQQRGIQRVELHASPAGASIYERLGFTWRTWHPEMIATLET